MFVNHFVSTSSQGSPWVQHVRILRFIVTWAFSTNEKVWKLSVSTRALSCQRRTVEDASFYFNLKSFSCQVQQEVFLTLVSDVFLNLSFDLPVLSPVRVVFVHLILILNWKLKIKSKIQNRLIPQELKITNLQSQLSIFVSKKDKIEKQFSMFWKSKNWKLKMVSWWLLFLVFKEKEN